MSSTSSTKPSVEWISQGIRAAFRIDDYSGSINHNGINPKTSIIALFQLIKKDLVETSFSSVFGSKGDPSKEDKVHIEDKTRNTIASASDENHISATNLGESLSHIKLMLFEEKKTRDDALNMTYHSNNNDENSNSHLKSVAGDTLKCLTETFHTSNIGEDGTQDENVLRAQEKYSLLQLLFVHLAKLPFEARKDVSSIFNYLLCCNIVDVSNSEKSEEESSMGNHQQQMQHSTIMTQFATFIQKNYLDIMMPLVEGHMNINVDVALHCGSMFRATLQHANLYQLLLIPQHACKLVYPFLDTLVHVASFEITSDALETLRLILTGAGGINSNSIDPSNNNISNGQGMEAMAAHFLEEEYNAIFVERFNPKLLCTGTTTVRSKDNPSAVTPSINANTHNNYITRRVSLQILTTILLTRANYNVMIKYISSKSNLRTIMILLRDASPHITLDAFHVFKIFVANPAKPSDIIKVLVDNKVKLIAYLETLHREREQSDEQFRDEKALVIATLQGLEY